MVVYTYKFGYFNSRRILDLFFVAPFINGRLRSDSKNFGDFLHFLICRDIPISLPLIAPCLLFPTPFSRSSFKHTFQAMLNYADTEQINGRAQLEFQGRKMLCALTHNKNLIWATFLDDGWSDEPEMYLHSNPSLELDDGNVAMNDIDYSTITKRFGSYVRPHNFHGIAISVWYSIGGFELLTNAELEERVSDMINNSILVESTYADDSNDGSDTPTSQDVFQGVGFEAANDEAIEIETSEVEAMEVEAMDDNSCDAAENDVESMNVDTDSNIDGPYSTSNSDTEPDELKEPSSATVNTTRNEASLGDHEHNEANSRELRDKAERFLAQQNIGLYVFDQSF
ncbi:hypothetical protein HBI56_235130 [Parastagonospora nodorum]|nr:hypothetical protein HBH77_234070 [Parastagonospora nodorum]KAH6478123.1 hypothetical protein HBI56_235130 [Parastagonospora nodorum]